MSDDAPDISFERRGTLGLVTLARPDALNALTHAMVRALRERLAAWADDDAIHAVAIRGTGRAFCAGGDIRAIHERGARGEPFDAFFADEYALNIAVHRFPKPYVALVDGIAMGGGVGVAYHGSHVVVGERARFAMPECGIGFHPDVGGSYLLSRLKGGTGRWLGLSGARLGPDGQLAAGIATHALPGERHDALIEALGDGASPDRALGELGARAAGGTSDEAHPLAPLFSSPDVRTIMGALEAIASDTSDPRAGEAASTREALRAKCPLSLAVALRLQALAADLSFERCMALEARATHRMLRGGNFLEGIRAAVIDKDGAPRWTPATLDAVGADEVEAHLGRVEEGPLRELSDGGGTS